MPKKAAYNIVEFSFGFLSRGGVVDFICRVFSKNKTGIQNRKGGRFRAVSDRRGLAVLIEIGTLKARLNRTHHSLLQISVANYELFSLCGMGWTRWMDKAVLPRVVVAFLLLPFGEIREFWLRTKSCSKAI